MDNGAYYDGNADLRRRQIQGVVREAFYSTRVFSGEVADAWRVAKETAMLNGASDEREANSMAWDAYQYDLWRQGCGT